MKFNIKEKLSSYKRILQVAKKPGFEDFSDTIRIVGIGFLVLGIIGFLIYLAATLVPNL